MYGAWCQSDPVCGVSLTWCVVHGVGLTQCVVHGVSLTQCVVYGVSMTQCVVYGAGHQYWLPEEDKVLLKRQPDHADWQSLEQQRGLPAVLQRIQWLQTSD